LSYAYIRGFTLEEVETAIRNSDWTEAEQGRLECRMNLDYRDIWNGTYYDTKQIRPIFVEEQDEIVVVTVYVYFF